MTSAVPLQELADINPSVGQLPSDGTPVSFVPMGSLDAVSGTVEIEERRFGQVRKTRTTFRDGDVLVAKITPCFENGKIAQAHLRHAMGVGSTEFHVVRARPDRADARFLLHFLRQPRVRLQGERRMTGSAGQRRVPENFLRHLRVPAPSLHEQRRIATVLDRADELRAKRRAAMEKLQFVKQSIFLDMFGSLEPRTPLATVADGARPGPGSIRTGPFGSDLLHSEFVNEGIGVLGIDNVVANKFRWGQMRYITSEKYQKLSRYTVSPGDVLISIMGTCGRCAVVPDDVGVAINTKHLCCISVDRERFLPEFLHAYFLWHPLARTYLARTTKGAIMSGLNMSIIKAMPLPLVAIEEQHEWARRLERVTSAVGDQTLAAESTAQLFRSLEQRAFAGAL